MRPITRKIPLGFLAAVALLAFGSGVAWAKEILRVYVSGGLLETAALISGPDDVATFRAYSPVMGDTPDPPVDLIDEPQISFPVTYELRLVLAGSAPDVLMIYYPDPAGERGYVFLDDSHFQGSPFWFRMHPAFDALMARYGAVLPATLPETGGNASAVPLTWLALLGLAVVGLGLGLRQGAWLSQRHDISMELDSGER